MDIFNGAAISLIFALVSIGFFIGAFAGYFTRKRIAKIQAGTIENKLDKLIEDSKVEAKRIVLAAKEEAVGVFARAREESKEREAQMMKQEERLAHREDALEQKAARHTQEEKELILKVEKIKLIKEEADRLLAEQVFALEKAAALTREEAKEKLFAEVEQHNKDDLVIKMRRLEKEGKEQFEKKAHEILATVIQRYASSQVSEVTTTTMSIPSDDMKGKIIGREGRNIRALERLTGAEIIVDDTPGTIVISCFDPVRRHICRLALEKLTSDGRIQPARIEEAVEKAKIDINAEIKKAGEAAAYDVGVVGTDPRLINLLGRLHYRTSFGQNVLLHSIEMAHISGMLAAELGADVHIAKVGALFHDIGKAIDHEVQGTHVEIGRKILQKFGVDIRVIQAMQSHHEEYPYATLESVIVQTADALSGGRPGARRGTIETYIRRLEELEAIANSFPGVEKAYAISAGREVRVFVRPEKIDDLAARKLPRNIADRVEKELKYPGEIKIHVIRETRVLEYAR